MTVNAHKFLKELDATIGGMRKEVQEAKRRADELLMQRDAEIKRLRDAIQKVCDITNEQDIADYLGKVLKGGEKQ